MGIRVDMDSWIDIPVQLLSDEAGIELVNTEDGSLPFTTLLEEEVS